MAMSATGTGTRINRVWTVGIPVSDPDRALEFYVETLGFEKRLDGEFGEGERWIEVAPPGGATTIALVRASAGTPVGIDTQVRLATQKPRAPRSFASFIRGYRRPRRTVTEVISTRVDPGGIPRDTGRSQP
jgi:catechol 2,3-dioxygenase-like lactoylglutathione lyase family enzyme